ncbi:hypothetical protein QWY99_21620 [Flavobacterium branchiarum]|uniref:Transmembrane protein n=1 Tax=Flavobacterium branchiarum TaxID=1114870 RepID=A0ABV5FK98_9FLAO|nr:hypothetical protein [Flavobacterium branchiarum]MDN3675635.1 hypothetical protein [Flavobacterium branchiarum]
MKKILPIISYLFHPLFISMYASVFYLFFKEDAFANEEKFFILFQIVIITVLVPILFFLLLRSTGNADSIMIHETSQRRIPLVLHCFLIILLVKRSVVYMRYPELHFFFLGVLFSTIIALVLSFFKIKASLHMMAISGLTIFAIGLSRHLELPSMLYWVAFFILMNGFVASSRLEMNAHTNKELLIGLLIGIIPQLLFLVFWL